MDTPISNAVAADASLLTTTAPAVFDQIMSMIAGRFARVQTRLNARDFIRGLLSNTERKTCWQLAEWSGHVHPCRMQRLLREAVWDHDGVRDDLRGFLVERLFHPHAVLIIDETGFVKKGTTSVGVQRQYSGTAGKIENCQIGVFLAYASPHGRALIDRRLYLPQSWTDDPARRADAGVPTEVSFATKPQLGLGMIAEAINAGVRVEFVTGDECYGRDPDLRSWLQRKEIGYVLAVARNHHTPITTWRRERVDVTEAWLSRQAWQRYSCGKGSKGNRYYDWAWVSLHEDTPGHHSLLIRRNRKGELAFYRCWTPDRVPLSTLVNTAGTRWCVEEAFQISKNDTGLDHYQCRGWTPWHRFTLLAMAAMAILTVLTTSTPAEAVGLIAMTVPETRRLLTILFPKPVGLAHALRWSVWRRRHQHRARASHYKQQAILESSQLNT